MEILPLFLGENFYFPVGGPVFTHGLDGMAHILGEPAYSILALKPGSRYLGKLLQPGVQIVVLLPGDFPGGKALVNPPADVAKMLGKLLLGYEGIPEAVLRYEGRVVLVHEPSQGLCPFRDLLVSKYNGGLEIVFSQVDVSQKIHTLLVNHADDSFISRARLQAANLHRIKLRPDALPERGLQRIQRLLGNGGLAFDDAHDVVYGCIAGRIYVHVDCSYLRYSLLYFISAEIVKK